MGKLTGRYEKYITSSQKVTWHYAGDSLKATNLHKKPSFFVPGLSSSGERVFLDLIKGHLPTKTRKVIKSDHYRLKIQPFKAGGYEVVCKTVSGASLHSTLSRVYESRLSDDELLSYYGNMSERKYQSIRNSRSRRVVSDLPSDYTPAHRSIQRSKVNSRYKIKSMGADRLLTLTARENDPDTYLTMDDWKRKWADFCRMMKRAGYPISDYVAVLERHKKGNFHLHVAIKGHVHINVARSIWWSILGGRGSGNVDVKFRPDMSPSKRLSGISRYLSKYLTKQFGDVGFNKKRYWSSKHHLPDSLKYAVSGLYGSVQDVLKEFCSRWGLDHQKLLISRDFFEFTNGSGFWMNFTEDVALPVPF